jgi:methylmalonyl-CoA/ethylmalonyl-CoA epimerase
VSPILLDHVAIGMPRMADAVGVLVGALGGLPDSGRSAGGVFGWGTWAFAGGGSIEVIEPLGEDGFLHRFLAARGPGIHHVTFKVPRLDAVCARARARGYDIVGYDASDPDWKEAFLHPKQALGIVVQLAEVRRDPAGAGRERMRSSAPPGLPSPPPPVAILGLRMRAHSRERADNQWGAVLEGQCHRGPGGELIYRWPPSPMRIAVAIDPGCCRGTRLHRVRGRPASGAHVGSSAAPGHQLLRRPAIRTPAGEKGPAASLRPSSRRSTYGE